MHRTQCALTPHLVMRSTHIAPAAGGRVVVDAAALPHPHTKQLPAQTACTLIARGRPSSMPTHPHVRARTPAAPHRSGAAAARTAAPP
eukprot:313929-Chlamydomonas_euryale.AAC.6